MSSTYHRICLSHEPPLALDEDIGGRTPPPNHPDHPNCQLALARRSGGLVEIWLPTPYSTADVGKWFDVTWTSRYPTLARMVLDGAA